MNIERPLWLADFSADRFLREADQWLSVALQPIVDASSGKVIAHEALVRGYDDLGFPAVAALFDHAVGAKRLFALDNCLMTKAMTARAALPHGNAPLLFINVDGRNLWKWRELCSFLHFQCDFLELRPSDICVELSETLQPLAPEEFAAAAEAIRRAGFLIAIDDFGTGNSGMQMLYQTSPDFIKIDRFFIKSMPDDSKKRLLVSSIVDLVHTLGARVIAEGVETVEELVCCREVRCDLVQGFLIARPTVDVTRLQPVYAEVALSADSPPSASDDVKIDKLIEDVAVLSEGAMLRELFDLIATRPAQTVFPVIDKYGLPRGAVRETDVKPLIYSRFGRDPAYNRVSNLPISDFVKPIATLESTTPLAPRLELIADRAGDGVIVTRSLEYFGYLSSSSLLKLANDIRLRQAAAQNPLTRLPGNNAIQTFLKRCVAESGACRIAAYIDIDNFKPFNDRYGFELGDRAILMMASILKSLERDHGTFVGHVGGDDFFVGGTGPACGAARATLKEVSERFRHVAESLYSAKDREAGFIAGRTRDGSIRKFPLLSCTVAAVMMPEGVVPSSTTEITARMSDLKMQARSESSPFRLAALGGGAMPPAC